jgi:hypothetical protein
MARYWRTVFSRAWDKTYKPLKWDRAQIAVVLVAIGTVIAAGLHLGLDAMLSSLIGYVWIAVPVAFAAAALFLWGMVEAISEIHAQQNDRIAQLETALAASKSPAPDYKALRHVNRFSLRDAAFLFCDLRPVSKMPGQVQDWYSALESSVRQGDLVIEPKDTGMGYLSKSDARQIERQRPQLDTVVLRVALVDFAKRHGHDPVFLRDKTDSTSEAEGD